MLTSACVSEAILDQYHGDELAEDRREAVRRHLEVCSSCAARSAELVRRREGLLGRVRALGLHGVPGDLSPVAMASRPSPRTELARTLAEAGYELVRPITRGGQGTIYEAIQIRTRRRVAIKVLAETQDRTEGARRFNREVEILAQLRHPNIVTVHDSGSSDAGDYFVMDFVDGPRLDAYCRAVQPTVREICTLFRSICAGVAAAHMLGIVHRDLKPANVLIDPEGQPRILDFGLARPTLARPGDDSELTITQPGQFVGTLAWASPEQAESRPADQRTDVYALGVMLYHTLTGCFPYPVNGGTRETLTNICMKLPDAPSSLRRDIGRELDAIVLKCLAKDPARRYADARALEQDLDALLEDRPVSARGESFGYVLLKAMRRHRMASASLVAALLSICGFAVGAVLYSTRLARERHEAEVARALAQEQRARADQHAEELRHTVYYQNIALAQRACDRYQAGQMRSFLDACPPDLRGWEWYRLNWMQDTSIRRVASGDLIDPYRDAWIHTRGAIHGHPIYSADGRHYALRQPEWIDIHSTEDGRVVQKISTSPTIAHWYAFSRDGSELAYSDFGAHTVHIVSIGTQPEVRATLTHGF